MAGRTNYTARNNGEAPTIPDHLNEAAEHWDELIGETVEEAADLPGSGNWAGRTIYVQDDDELRVWTGSSWGYAGARRIISNLQTDTTNTVVTDKVERGFGKITGSASVVISEAVTFPSAFAAVPHVSLNFMGKKAAGSFNPSGLTQVAPISGTAQAATTTGFAAVLYATDGGNFTTEDWYYSWEARGLA